LTAARESISFRGLDEGQGYFATLGRFVLKAEIENYRCAYG